MKTFENIIGAIVYVPIITIILIGIGLYQFYLLVKYCVYSLLGKEFKY